MQHNNLPLVSIITPSYNQAFFLEQMLLSIHQQDYPNIEHIVVDGGSTDGTLELLKQHQANVSWLSEPDRGQAEAINKGFRLAKGDFIGWLNCDDLYTPGAIRAIVDYFQTHEEVVLLYGDALAIDEHDLVYGLRINVKPCDFTSLVEQGDFIVQPAVFWRAKLWHILGPLDENLHYTFDYEYWMRAAKNFSLSYVPICLAQERIHANAKTSNGYLNRIKELEMVALKHGGGGIPRKFLAESAATYMRQAIYYLHQKNWQAASNQLTKVLKLRPPFLKFMLYLVTMTLFGYRTIPRLRLWSNRLRSRRKPIFPILSEELS